MPLYDYRCRACAATFERRHGYDEPAGTCPACGSATIARQLPAIAVQVKGGRVSSGAAVAEMECSPQGCARPGCPTAALN